MIDLHGGIAVTWDFDLQLWWRRGVFKRTFVGKVSHHRERAAALAWS